MNTSKIASVLLTAAIMTGCASTSSEPTGSYARQVATAGGLRLEDQKVPKAQYDASLSSVTDAGLNTSVLASSHGFNMNGGAALGVGLAAWLLTPTPLEKKDAVIAFAPMHESDKTEAGRGFANALAAAYKQAFEDMDGFTSTEIFHVSNALGDAFIVGGKGPGCPNTELGCSYIASVIKPEAVSAPSVLFSQSKQVYRFSAKDGVLSGEDHTEGKFDKSAFLLNVSKHLPDWAYVYAAPVPKVSPPMIFHKGEVHYFVVPDA
ncbi:hypothetical protein IQ22_04364 [Pseudomonas duriflava]|uniref:Lipoprotein n=1 Tax=Pseudomonas duriflava TaxID=459528 RepID=A0A562PRN5_9PSED|nr:hypothetical protein [Pseudomonas duriflava]TWI47092.1 hypothetical protein IQ22_04364 [Pseudomonas duriflava]